MMPGLVNESCSACQKGAPRATEKETSEWMQQLQGWDVTDVDGVLQLRRQFTFDDFCEALDFTVAVGELAEGANHHPTILLEWGKVTVTWWTHAIDGLHRNDFIMAAKTDYLHSK